MMTVILEANSRERMVASAAVLLREQGYTGTSFGDVIEHSRAPRGSIYHHFPGGKAQLVEEATRLAGGYVSAALDRAATTGDLSTVLREFVALWRVGLERSDFRAGCPVVAVANEAHDEAPRLVDAAAEVFDAWHARLVQVLRGEGVPRARAERLARLIVASIEGAVILARAQRSTRPLDDVGRELEALVRESRRP